MKTIFYLLILFTFSNVVYSQTTNHTFVKELQNQDIDTICVYGNYCGLCLSPILCEELDSVYIFWQSQGKNFVKRMSLCYNYVPVEIDTVAFWNTFFKHKATIKTEKVEPFVYDIVKKRNKTIESVIGLNDGSYQTYTIITKNDTTEFTVGTIEFRKEYNNKTNMNYLYNNNLKGKIVFDEIQNLVLKLEKEQKFIIQKEL